ncbi:MAG TPA: ATP-binding protein [Acidobacteriota bacterium]|nr:ATP-binding protein [Acidobacteriota bacterium]
MRRSGFIWKLYAGYVVLILLTVAIVGVMVSRTIERDTLAQIQDALRTRAEMMRGLLAAPHDSSLTAAYPFLQERIRPLGRETNTRLTIIGSDGRVLADSDDDPAQMDNHGSRPEILQARSHGMGLATRFSKTLGTDMMYVALPLRQDDATIGYVRTALPLTTIRHRLASIRRVVILGALLAALVALPLGFWVARRVTAPLGAMTLLAEEIARGECARRVRSDRRDEIGQLAAALNTMAKQTQQRMEMISRERNQLHAVLAGMAEGVIAVDLGERIVHINSVAGRMLGIDPQRCLGRILGEATRVAGITDILARAQTESEPVAEEMRIAGPARDRIMLAYASLLRDTDQNASGVVIVLQDVTDLRHLESVRHDFVANVSHELKTPITAAQGLVETMLSDTSMDDATRQKFLGRLRHQISRLGTLVGDLLTLSRIESQKVTRPLHPIDLREPIRDTVDAFAAAAQANNLALEMQLPQMPLSVFAEAGVVEQIVGSLLDNALKYTKAGGRITVSVRGDSDRILLAVADTGIGIDPVHQERIFERFYRIDKARSRELGGTGLGLAIVRHLVISLSGSIALKSTPGLGSTFEISLPPAPTTEHGANGG